MVGQIAQHAEMRASMFPMQYMGSMREVQPTIELSVAHSVELDPTTHLEAGEPLAAWPGGSEEHEGDIM